MTTRKLQEALIYSVIVAGKNAQFADGVMAKIIESSFKGEELFYFLESCRLKGVLDNYLRLWKTGNYKKLHRSISEILIAHNSQTLDLRKCKPADLERIHGIGPKTSRFFITWTRPKERYAVLDVHIMRWLRSKKRFAHAPVATPSGAQYLYWEKRFIAIAEGMGMTPRELDRKIWLAGSKYLTKKS